jgi:UDP-2,3-diacylglucosamine pyrophosphatase LpxH
MDLDAPTRDHASATRYRTVWISDVHLGTRGCQADKLLDFLYSIDCDYLFLVGDIIDGWRLKRSWYWPQAHNNVVRKILGMARKGTRITYVPGNHDEIFRDYIGLNFGQIDLVDRAVHTLVDGRRLLVIHGDQFDTIVKNARWLAYIGDYAYRAAMRFNILLNFARRKLGFGYWSLSSYLKHQVKQRVSSISNFENALADEARRHNVEGVVCGHIHHPEIREVGGIVYCNDGDWVESCTALVEHNDGRIELLYWKTAAVSAEKKQREPALAPA